MLVESLTSDALELVRPKLEQLAQEKKRLQQEYTSLERARQDLDETADRAMALLKSFLVSLNQGPPERLKALIQKLVQGIRLRFRQERHGKRVRNRFLSGEMELYALEGAALRSITDSGSGSGIVRY